MNETLEKRMAFVKAAVEKYDGIATAFANGDEKKRLQFWMVLFGRMNRFHFSHIVDEKEEALGTATAYEGGYEVYEGSATRVTKDGKDCDAATKEEYLLAKNNCIATISKGAYLDAYKDVVDFIKANGAEVGADAKMLAISGYAYPYLPASEQTDSAYTEEEYERLAERIAEEEEED